MRTGKVLELDSGELAFNPAEIAALFSDAYAMQLSDPEVEMLAHRTEGWPIALQLAWQGMRGRRQDSAHDLLAGGPLSHPALFEYLAHDVLERQPPAVQRFLMSTAVLRRLTPAACDAVTESDGATAVLALLHEADLFLVDVGDGAYRYHHLFHDFLLQSAAGDPVALAGCHRRAAAFSEGSGQLDDGIYHWLAAGEFHRAADAIEKMGDVALRAGRLDTVASWVAALPVAVVEEHPLLLAFLGDIHRLRSQFDEALAWYASAERAFRTRSDWTGASRALRGQALVYLDTVRPAQAESLLEEALRLIDRVDDRAARARLLELLAENKLNMGKPAEAEQLRLDAAQLRFEGAGEDALSVRVKLRTGRLDEAASILEGWEEAERAAAQRGVPREPRSHRETLLILSLIRSFRGDPSGARRMAEDAVTLGLQLDSPFITAVAQTRLGHATQLRPQPSDSMIAAPEPPSPDESLRCYRQSIELGDRISVRRTRCEAMWGLTRAYGFFGDLASAEATAAEGAEIGLWAGDPWIVALIDLALGASRLLAGHNADAIGPLQRSLAGLRDCGDPFGRAAARLWLALGYLALNQHEHLYPCLDDLLTLCESHGYEFLFTSPSLLGPPDRRRLVPLLLWAQAHSLHPAYAGQLLREMGVPLVKVHPGYQLRVQTLGAFRVWRGDEEVAQREWQRDKARQLFQLLLAQRNRWLQRERLTETLWPELDPDAAARDFKVALNCLIRALEPAHAPDTPFVYVEREGSVYRPPPFRRPLARLGSIRAALRRRSIGDRER